MQGSRRRIREAFTVSLVLIFTFMATAVLGQLGRQVDQGKAPWKFYLCDSSGTNCVGTETTATAGVYRLLTSTGGGAGGGTVAQGAAGATAWPMTLSGATITLPVNVTNPSFPVTQSGTWTAGNTATNNALAIRCVDPTGTAFVACGPTTVTAISPTTFTAAQGAAAATGWPVTESGAWTVTQGAAGGTAWPVTLSSVTATVPINVAQVLGSALSTANPVIDGGRVQTATFTPFSNAAAAPHAVDKYGRLVVMPCAQDMIANGTFTLTATTASTILAATDTNTRYMVMTVYACNTSTAATRLDIRDNTTALFPMVWTQTTNVGEERCSFLPLVPPYVVTASNPVTVALATAVTDVRGFIGACKTGT